MYVCMCVCGLRCNSHVSRAPPRKDLGQDPQFATADHVQQLIRDWILVLFQKPRRHVLDVGCKVLDGKGLSLESKPWLSESWLVAQVLHELVGKGHIRGLGEECFFGEQVCGLTKSPITIKGKEGLYV